MGTIPDQREKPEEVERQMNEIISEPPRIAGPVPHPSRPRVAPPPGAWDTHAHIFGPSDKFPYQPGRGYTPPDAPVERFIALLDHLGFAKGLVVQGNAHVYDNSVVLDALTRFPARLRGVAITDTRIEPETLHDWHERGMRGLRFHLFPQRPNYIRGIGLDVFAVFRRTMAELGWVVQFFCDHRMLAQTAAVLRDIAREMTVIVDHLGMVPAAQGITDPNFQSLLKLVGDGHAYVKLSAVYRLSTQFPDYPDAKPLHDAFLAANPERLMWGTDWPHPSIAAAVMPDDGHLLDLFHAWTPDEQARRRILVDTPARLFGR
jgi:predicted TIM-barrel fold metal-dependent hydrolase